MSGPSPADLVALVNSLTETVQSLEALVDELKQECRSDISSSGTKPPGTRNFLLFPPYPNSAVLKWRSVLRKNGNMKWSRRQQN